MLQSHGNDQNDRAVNLALIALICLFAFVVIFVFIGVNLERATRSDLPPSATIHQTAGDSGTRGATSN